MKYISCVIFALMHYCLVFGSEFFEIKQIKNPGDPFGAKNQNQSSSNKIITSDALIVDSPHKPSFSELPETIKVFPAEESKGVKDSTAPNEFNEPDILCQTYGVSFWEENDVISYENNVEEKSKKPNRPSSLSTGLSVQTSTCEETNSPLILANTTLFRVILPGAGKNTIGSNDTQKAPLCLSKWV